MLLIFFVHNIKNSTNFYNLISIGELKEAHLLQKIELHTIEQVSVS